MTAICAFAGIIEERGAWWLVGTSLPFPSVTVLRYAVVQAESFIARYCP